MRRADEHFKVVQREIGKLRTPKADQFITDYDTRRGQMITRAAPSLSARNDEWSTIIGDCVHNLRSALDHLAHELVILGGGVPVVGRSGTAFPIYGSLVGPNGGPRVVQVNSTNGTISPDALAFIEGLQPCQPWNNAKTHPLLVLSELDNMDKYRTLALTTVALADFGLGINLGEVNNVELRAMSHIGGFVGPFDENTVLAHFEVTAIGPNPRVKVKPKGTIEVAFAAPCINAGEGVIASLADLRDYVADVIEILKEIGLRTAVPCRASSI